MTDLSQLRHWNTIRKYQYVSFDIFDTLIKRTVAKPTDVFDIVGRNYNSNHRIKVSSFCEKRRAAEKEARSKSNKEEVTLDDIYEYLNLSDSAKSELKALEIQTEMDVCVPNLPIRSLYNRCLKSGKKVIITSDMYLPEEIIRSILNRCGYAEPCKFYLSSSIGLQKFTGSLYKYVLHDLHISSKELIHIGDSKRADFLAAAKQGIHPVLISRNVRNTNFVDGEVLQKQPYVFINIMLPRYHKKTELFQWGYEAYGSLILGFCEWIHKLYEEKGIKQMFFLARDMNVMLDVYQKLYPEDKVKYLEVSRRSLRIAYILKLGRLDAVYDTMARLNYSIKQICDSVGLDVDDVIAACRTKGITITEDEHFPENQSDKYKVLNSVILAKLHESDDKAENYLREMGFYENNSIAIADIGWHGTIQNMLEIIADKHVAGFYFGSTVRNYFREMDVSGYWFNATDEYSILPKLTMISVLEVMLFPKIGTTVSYSSENGKTVPVYGPCEMDDSFHYIQEFQDGAKHFIEDYTASPVFSIKELIPSEIAASAYEKLAYRPTLHQAEIIGNLPYEEGKVIRIAGAQALRHYLSHPKDLARDYKNVKWKTGFIKRVFPVISDPHAVDSFIKNRNRNKAKDMKE